MRRRAVSVYIHDQVSASLTALPIDSHLPAMGEALAADRALVVVAEPGAGKTTRVPPALLSLSGLSAGEVWVLQPRRIAARMAARRVAAERGSEVGQEIGYQVRFEEKVSRATRVRFVTEAMLTRRLLADPQLPGIASVVMDEFHERSWHADFLLACLRHLMRTTRPDLMLVVMSATLEAQPVAEFLECQPVYVPGRPYPVDVGYAPPESPRAPLSQTVARALRQLLREAPDDTGDVLCFLPGAAEIRRVQASCEPICEAAGMALAVLHGDLSPQAQDSAVARGPRRKVILSTNIAETSLTLEGVTAVLDAGLVRVPVHSPFSGLPTLQTKPISQASAVQRAGRAGRVQKGRCLRLYHRHDFLARPAHDVPELQRADLTELALCLAALPWSLTPSAWLEPPPAAAIERAEGLLGQLGALDGTGALTPSGRALAALPLHPRLSRLMVEAEARGVGFEGATVAALLSEPDILRRGRSQLGARGPAASDGPSDLLHRLDLIERLDGSRAAEARQEGVDPGALRGVLRVRDRLLSRARQRPAARPEAVVDADAGLGMAVLSAFGDRVARRRRPGSDELVFASGGSATVAEESVVKAAQWVVVVDAMERQGRGRGVVARVLSAIEPEWLIELFPDRVEDRERTVFDATTERVDRYTGLAYGSLMLEESRAAAEGEEVEAALAQVAADHGYAKLFDLEAADAVLRRWRFAATRGPLAAPPEDALQRAVREACRGHCSLADLRSTELATCLLAVMGYEHLETLDRVAPKTVQLGSGRRLRVNYEPDRPPWVASRLQDFFGLSTGPHLGGEPLVLHLLAPNQRAVQVTQDLAGFWARHYPEQRRVLMRRYPKHAWPEDPLTASPPAPRPARGPRRKPRSR